MGDCAEGEPDESRSLLCGEQASRRGSLPGCKWGGQVSDDQLQQPRRQWKWGEVEDSGALLPCSLLSQPMLRSGQRPCRSLPQTQQGTPIFIPPDSQVYLHER